MSADLQLDLFDGPAVPFDPAPPAGTAPANVQGALFRPDFAAMRAPRRRARAAAAPDLDPGLHDETLS